MSATISKSDIYLYNIVSIVENIPTNDPKRIANMSGMLYTG